ncbi:peptidoglycan-binding protein [Streptomyces sp. NPDC001750]|uniref:peptidoglycan-binding domain-containing protein n=1 Tax=Streptomyces sp. NPDC001750 TaxID=3364607 RepID=UPI00367F7810
MFTPTSGGGVSGGNGDPGTGSVCACGGGAARRPGEGQEAAERRRAERSAADRAEVAASEDFDPLRVRPYVKLRGDVAPEADDARLPHPGRPHAHSAEDADETMPLLLGPPGPGSVTSPGGLTSPGGPAGPGGPRQPGGPAQVGSPGHRDGSGHPGGPGQFRDPAQFGSPPPPQAATGPVDDATILIPRPSATAPADASDRSRRRSPLAAFAAGAAALAVVGTAVFASGLFESNDDRPADREMALPDLPLSTPEVSSTAKESAPASASPPSSGRASASPSASSSAGTSPSPSASATTTPPDTAPPSATAPQTSRPTSAAPPASLTGPTLRPGDQGPAVAELQRRLEEVWLFHGQDDGDYTAKVEHAVSVYQSYKFIQGDPPGVYGPHTRRALEAETSGRGRS